MTLSSATATGSSSEKRDTKSSESNVWSDVDRAGEGGVEWECNKEMQLFLHVLTIIDIVN